MSEPVPDLRVGDRERGETDALLRDALADGVLSLTEYGSVEIVRPGGQD